MIATGGILDLDFRQPRNFYAEVLRNQGAGVRIPQGNDTTHSNFHFTFVSVIGILAHAEAQAKKTHHGRHAMHHARRNMRWR